MTTRLLCEWNAPVRSPDVAPTTSPCMRVVYHESLRTPAIAQASAPAQAPRMMRVSRAATLSFGALFFVLGACGDDRPVASTGTSEPLPPPPPPVEPDPVPVPDAPVMHEPVAVYESGSLARTVDAATEAHLLVLDVGDDWTPYLFTESDPGGTVMPHPYRATYLALARGELPDDYHGERARSDKYLELYGIPPTITVLRERMRHMSSLACAASLDLAPIVSFTGSAAFEDSGRAVAQARRFVQAEHLVTRLRTAQGIAAPAVPDATTLARADQDLVREFTRGEARFRLIDAVQKRLQCEGYFVGKRAFVRGAFDASTHEAIAEFERRHRLLGFGNLGRETLTALRKSSVVLEQEAVVRVLTERGLHQVGAIEDGSMATLADGRANTFAGPDGREIAVPNMERAIRERITSAFGLTTPEATLAFLNSLETIGATRKLAMADVDRPAYYSADMDLSIEIDRGDVWYEFPYDEHGVERAQGVDRRPNLTVYVTYHGRKIPLARFGTTIGGWRTEFVDGVVMWAYKESPPGPVVWEKIVSAPVWLPPETAPPRSLLVRGAHGWAPNRHETGPSYASAYGLVAAYHRPFVRGANGQIEVRGDQGIRTHGSVDYMSIARRHSHGCHRLHNHIAVRLMSFVLAHRPHRREGEDEVHYGRTVELEGHSYTLRVDQGGYEFALARPIPVEVLPGRILGERTLPIETNLPRYDSTIGAYLLPDGGAATVDRQGNVTAIPWPLDAGVPNDAGARDVLDGSVAHARDAGVAAPAPAPAPTPEPTLEP